MGGGGGSNEAPVYNAERENAYVSADQYNEYLKGKPLETAYLDDIMQSPDNYATAVKGEANADIAQKTPTVAVRPGMGMNTPALIRNQEMKGSVMGAIDRDAIAQNAATKKGAVENAMGFQTTVNSARTGMAADAVSKGITNMQNDYTDSASTKSSIATLSGMGAGMAIDKARSMKAAA